jgi:Na+/H+-translocating membrane pyrophosphatase
LAFLVLFIIAIAAAIMLAILIFAMKKTMKILLTLVFFLTNCVAVILSILFLDDFAKKGPQEKKYLFLVLPGPILSLISYLLIKKMVKEKFSNPAYKTVLRMYLLGKIDSVKGYIRRRELIRRREARLAR